MTETTNQYQKEFLSEVVLPKQSNNLQLFNSRQFSQVENSSSYNDNDEHLVDSPFRASDPTMINRHKIVGFQKTGQLIRRIKRQLSTQNLQKSSSKASYRANDKLSTQHSHNNLNQNQFISKMAWEKCQKDQMTQAMIDQYQKQILRLRVELQDIKEEKKQIKQTLQKQRRFYMTQMYSKQLIAQQNQFLIDKLKGQIQKHINLQYQFQQKIRLLQLENSQYKYQLQDSYQYSHQNSQQQGQMETIYEENQDFCNQSNSYNRNKASNKMFMSLDNGFCKNLQQQDPFQLIRLAHQKEILQYQRELKNLKQFYENRIKLIRKSHTPQKNRPRNSISIMDQYVCNDTISCQSQSYQNPQNLKFLLKDYQQNSKSSKRVVQMDCQSNFTIRHFGYPNQFSKKSLDNNITEQDIFIKQSLSEKDYKQIEIQESPVVFEEQIDEKVNEVKKNKIEKLINYLPTKQFMKGMTVGCLASGILAFIINKKLNSSL